LSGNSFDECHCHEIVGQVLDEINGSGLPFTLRLFETWENESERLLTQTYSGATVILLCFGLDRRESFENLTKRWIPEARRYGKDPKIVLIGTMVDIRDARDREHVTDEEAWRLGAAQHCETFITCSARYGQGIDQIFPAATKACEEKRKEGCLVM
jgi:GTPase SAR1 family protein